MRVTSQPARPRLIEQTTIDASVRFLIFTLLHYLRDEAGYDVRAACAPGPYVRQIEAAGFRVYRVPMTRRITPLADLATLARLIWRYRRVRPAIVHTHTPKANLLGPLAARLAGVPVVGATVHGLFFHEASPWWRKLAFGLTEAITGRLADAVFVLNPEDAATMRRLRLVPPSKLVELGSGIDLTGFDPNRYGPEARAAIRAELGLAADAPVIGFVGRLVREKGVMELLTALPLVARAVPAVRLVLAGAWDREKPDAIHPRLVDELGLSDRVVVLGHRADVDRLYAAMDVVALPTYREGFPRVPMEAAAAGVPVVATNVRGCRQTVRDGETGRLVPPRDVPALAAALTALLTDRPQRERLGQAARHFALTEFDERRVFRRVADTFDRLLAERHPSRRP